ncbi:alkaline phosphatase-like [Lytechinus variegatus]|uniref:alkaline phosphatase-like n=1 Tax=Lytechinus variegatus TaxID=7654 RepID=UPI001BB266D9|nr:alkaline phosphatase-like [Lytechinus variegatus]
MLTIPLFIVSQFSDASYWNARGRAALEEALQNQRLNLNIAKNIIFFLGDGLDVTTTTAARIRKGQLAGGLGEEASLHFESFPHVGLVKTYNTDRQVPDSAGTATAYLCGVKSKFGTLGVDDRVERGKCSSIEGAAVDSILIDSMKAGKSTGFVTTARVTHASPAALYAHTPDRRWENDKDLDENDVREGCKDIALQLVEHGKTMNVIMGGGRRELTPRNVEDPEYDGDYGQRRDGRNLIEDWLKDKDSMRSHYVWNLGDFNRVNPETTDHLIGLFQPSHMKYEADRRWDRAGEPSLAQMTEKAIKILQRTSDNGFFLFVEAGRIDHGHHDGMARDALTETLAMDDAIGVALRLTSSEDTLIVSTADHAHVMTMAGYPSRGNPILGLEDHYLADDDLPYATLSYANGPGALHLASSFRKHGTRENLTTVDTEETGHQQQALVPFDEETHGGQDVMVYARGPMSHLFHGVQEQSYIPHAIRYAACLAGETEHCINGQARWCEGATASASSSSSSSSRTKDQAEVEAHVGGSAISWRTHTGIFHVIVSVCLSICVLSIY